MGRMELLILATAIILFSVFSATANNYQQNLTKNNLKTEYLSTAKSIAESILERSKTLDFDRETAGNNSAPIGSASQFTPPDDLGPDNSSEITPSDGIKSIRDFDDIDDLNTFYKDDLDHLPERSIEINYSKGDRNYNLGYFKHKIRCSVNYVRLDGGRWVEEDGQTYHKKITVEVFGQEGFLSEPVKFTRVVTYSGDI